MAATLANEGTEHILDTISANTTAEVYVCRLFVADTTPAVGDTVATYTEMTAAGYAALNITTTEWTITPANPSTMVSDGQAFSFNSTSSDVIYGAYLTTAATSILIQAEKFAASITPAANGDVLTVTVELDV